MISGSNYSMFSVESAFFVELFPSHTRFSGIAVSRELLAVIDGGLAPIIPIALVVWSGGSYVPVAWYMIAMAVITIVALVCLPETKDREIGAD
jgi:MFS transporter, MHS family, shikimate and dehydroshikimate transport protein